MQVPSVGGNTLSGRRFHLTAASGSADDRGDFLASPVFGSGSILLLDPEANSSSC